MAAIANPIQYGGDPPINIDIQSAPHTDSLENQIVRNRNFKLQRQKGIRNLLQRQNAISEDVNKDEDDDEAKAEKHYLKNVRIIMMGEENPKLLNNIPEIKNKILNPKIMNLTADKAQIQEVIDLVTKNKETKIKDGKAEWMYCERSCVKTLTRQIKKEMNSTAFMLRVLTNSVIDTTENELPMIFTYEPGNGELSGVWENDHQYFKLKELDPQSQQSRLIMGLGPSAAGKTFWAKNVIKLMGKTNDTFPRSFLSVDGGLIRELSYVYQDIVTSLAKHKHISGFENLVSSGWDPFHKSLFKAGHVKKSVREYLKSQKPFSDSKLPVSIYVPETLGSPMSDGFKKGVAKYVKITGDNDWIGLYIWQGRTPEEDDDWVNKFKKANLDFDFSDVNIDAKSTTVSGKGRELAEGKKYSSYAYNFSKKHGYHALKKAPGARIDIHNSGGKKTDGEFNKSVVIEYPNANGEYLLNKEMLDEFNSIYFQKPLDLLGKVGGRKTRRRLRRKSRRKRTKRRRKKKRRKTKHRKRKTKKR